MRNDETVPPVVASAAFSVPRPGADGAEVSLAEGPNAFYAVRVISATPGGLDLLGPQERAQAREQARAARASQAIQAYLEDMREKADVTIFESSLQQ